MLVVFWIIIAIMTLGAVALVARPLLSPRKDDAARGAHALEVYRQQLLELEGEQTRGVISGEEALAARLEIERRMLRAADEAAAVVMPVSLNSASRPGVYLALGTAVLVPVLAFGIYIALGSPGEKPNRNPPQIAGADTEHMDMAGLTEKLVARLAQTPEDLQGWMLLGRSYVNLGNYPKAIEAYGRAVALTEGTPAPMVLAEYAEALVQASDGLVTPEAQERFRQVLKILPNEPRSQFYLGLARAQSGDAAGALQDWVRLLKQAEPGAPWAGAVRAQAQEVADMLKIDLAAQLPPEPVSAENPQPSSQPGPDVSDMAAAAAMPEGDRKQMIESMVARLAARLETEEKDNVDGWLKLARAYGVLGRKEDALTAFGKAVEADPKRMDALSAYGEALQEAGETQPVTDRFAQTMQRILAVEPHHNQALWFLGAFAAQKGDTATARLHWERLRAGLTPETEEFKSVSRALEGLGKS